MTGPLPASPCPLRLSIPVMSNYLRCPGSIRLPAYFTNSGTCSVLGAVLVASRILTRLNLVTNLTLEERFRSRAMVTELLSGGARSTQGVGLCLNLRGGRPDACPVFVPGAPS